MYKATVFCSDWVTSTVLTCVLKSQFKTKVKVTNRLYVHPQLNIPELCLVCIVFGPKKRNVYEQHAFK